MKSKDRIINDYAENIAALMESIGATPSMQIMIIESVKRMVESAYMDGRIDKAIEIGEVKNEQCKH